MYVRSVLVEQAVPEGLAEMPPGPGLAAALATLDLPGMAGDDVVDVMLAQSRQLAHEQARMFAVLSEVICRRPFAGPGEVRRAETPELYGADEVRAALAWTRRAADAETDLAFTLVHKLPRVLEALGQGYIDRSKAVVFAHHLAELSDTRIATICAAVLPHAPRLTTGQIAERIKRLILELDPAYYERRYRKAVRDRMVVAYLAADGTAVISAGGLPADEAAAAWERLDALARAARHDGHPATLDQIRADLVLGLLDGSLHGLSRGEILRALLGRLAGHVDPGSGASGSGEGGSTDPSGPGPSRSRDDPRVGTEIRVALSTLLGLDQRAGELPGWGPVPATAARRTVAHQRRAEWRWVVLDHTGHLLAEGLTRRRPHTLTRHGPSGGIVEIQVPAELLAALADTAHEHGPWAEVITDIAARYRRRRGYGSSSPGLDAHPHDRFPRAALRRHVQVRDRTCVHPGCRTPARRCDTDHTRDHARGGTTTHDDLAPLCRHHHMLKTEGGWRLSQPEPGRFVWTSPLGRSYPVAPEPILLPPRDPDPAPRTDLHPDRAPPASVVLPAAADPAPPSAADNGHDATSPI